MFAQFRIVNITSGLAATGRRALQGDKEVPRQGVVVVRGPEGWSDDGTVFAWTAIISRYAGDGQLGLALSTYERMLRAGVKPNSHTFVNLLKACTKSRDLQHGKRIHAHARARGLESHGFVASALISMYAKCGSVADAQQVFDALPRRRLDIVSWNAMISAHAQQQQGEQALCLFRLMQDQAGVTPNARTFVSTLQACGGLAREEEGALVDGQQVKLHSLLQARDIHDAARKGGFDSHVFVANSLLTVYSKCGSIEDAERVFHALCHCDLVSWNAMLAAYAQQQNLAPKALALFQQMRRQGVRPDARSLVSVLQACSSMPQSREEVLRQGREVHGVATACGLDSHVFVANALLTMYGKCGSIEDARQVFENLRDRDVVSWTAMIAAYVQQEQSEAALHSFWQMQAEGVRPDARAFVTALQACGNLAEKELSSPPFSSQTVKPWSLQRGKEVHAAANAMGFDSDSFVGNCLISMYAKCGSTKHAEEVFCTLSKRDVVSWTAMVEAYAHNDQAEKALQFYSLMQAGGMKSNEATFISVLKACSSIGALEMCVRTHQSIVQSGFGHSLCAANSLIHAYGNCGSMVDAQCVFNSVAYPDVVSWSALIAGYARQGDCLTSINCYERMRVAGVEPNAVTFLALLSACCHAGMVDKGLECFESMTRDHGMSPELEHFACVIDLVGRAGLFSKAEELVSQMPMKPDLPVWLCLLGACRNHGNVTLGKRAFDGAVQLQPRHAAAYILMANIYMDAGMEDNAKGIDELKQGLLSWKKTGQSWIEHDQEVHTFLVGDRIHPQEAVIYKLLKLLSSQIKKHA